MFNEGDLVRIVRQPHNQFAILINQVGFIEEIDVESSLASVQAIKINGDSFGFGTVPLNCLALEHTEAWKLAYENYGLKQALLINQHAKFTRYLDEELSKIAEKHDIELDKLIAIRKDLIKMENNLHH